MSVIETTEQIAQLTDRLEKLAYYIHSHKRFDFRKVLGTKEVLWGIQQYSYFIENLRVYVKQLNALSKIPQDQHPQELAFCRVFSRLLKGLYNGEKDFTRLYGILWRMFVRDFEYFVGSETMLSPFNHQLEQFEGIMTWRNLRLIQEIDFAITWVCPLIDQFIQFKDTYSVEDVEQDLRAVRGKIETIVLMLIQARRAIQRQMYIAGRDNHTDCLKELRRLSVVYQQALCKYSKIEQTHISLSTMKTTVGPEKLLNRIADIITGQTLSTTERLKVLRSIIGPSFQERLNAGKSV